MMMGMAPMSTRKVVSMARVVMMGMGVMIIYGDDHEDW
jgi:hypothetical protein